jgi:hypothetical protein
MTTRVRVGDFLVRDGYAREVVSEGPGHVWWREYHLVGGERTGLSGACSPARLAAWGRRHAYPGEVAGFKRADA